MPVTFAEPSNELCIEWQPSHSATPPEWKAYALPKANANTAAKATLRSFMDFLRTAMDCDSTAKDWISPPSAAVVPDPGSPKRGPNAWNDWRPRKGRVGEVTQRWALTPRSVPPARPPPLVLGVALVAVVAGVG